jgi:hypothetical protein
VTRDLGAAGRGPRFLETWEKLNENLTALLEVLTRVRINVGSVVLLVLIGVYVPPDDCQTGGAKSRPSRLADVQMVQFPARS